jgi:DNA-binding NarL/FixJ family response regulator
MVVDDHPMWRDAVARDLTEAGYAVVATAADGAQALRVAGAARPDVVVLDLQLPDMSGVEVTRGLRAAHPSARVLVLSASGEQQDVLDAVKAGAVGYLLKSAARPEFLDAVRRTAGGDAVFTPGLAALVLGEFRRLAAAPGADATADRAGNRDPADGGHRPVLQADCRPARALPPHGAEPRPEHAGQAAAAQPGRAGQVRHRARPRGRA